MSILLIKPKLFLKTPAILISEKRAKSGFRAISPVLARRTPPSPPYLLSCYTTFDHNNINLPSPALHTVQPPAAVAITSTMKISNDEAEAPHTAIIPQPAKETKKGTDIILNDDAWVHIVSFVGAKTLTILACAGKTTRDAAVFRDVADGSFSLMQTTERHFVELAKKDGYNAYFQDLFASPTRSDVCPHEKWEAWFATLGDIGTLKGKVPTGVTAGVLRLLRYGSRAQLEALAKLAGKEEGFDDRALTLEARKRLQRVLEKEYESGKAKIEKLLLPNDNNATPLPPPPPPGLSSHDDPPAD